MHNLWRNKKMGNNILPESYPVYEIDDSVIFGNNETIYWMFV